MREIKFRAWDAFNRIMWGTDPCYKNDLATFFKEYEAAVDGENNPILMQFTGLQDKNGKDIYEGDIVNYGDNYPSEVRYTSECEILETCGFYLFEQGRGAEWERYYPRTHQFFCQTNPIEVLGNIYENPELLK